MCLHINCTYLLSVKNVRKKMDNLVQYTYSCSNAMFKFLKDFDVDKLIADLRRIELHAYNDDDEPEDKGLWFKFGHDCTGATTIRDIKEDLNGVVNRQYRIDSFKLVTEDLDPNKELRVFFS
jgi:hypothetical protein